MRTAMIKEFEIGDMVCFKNGYSPIMTIEGLIPYGGIPEDGMELLVVWFTKNNKLQHAAFDVRLLKHYTDF